MMQNVLRRGAVQRPCEWTARGGLSSVPELMQFTSWFLLSIPKLLGRHFSLSVAYQSAIWPKKAMFGHCSFSSNVPWILKLFFLLRPK